MRDYGIDAYLSDLNLAIDDLGGRASLVGLCQAGWLAAAYAARFPGKVARLVLAGAPVDPGAAELRINNTPPPPIQRHTCRRRYNIGEDHRNLTMGGEETPVIFDDLGLRQINELRVRRRILSFLLTGVQRKILMTDKILRQTIVDELDFEPSVDSANIGVAVDNGVVTLTGHVASYAEKVAAERAVERIKGVRAIAENIEVRYPGHKQTADDEIAERALSILGWNVQVPKDLVKVKVEKGWVTLSGAVHWQYQRVAAEFSGSGTLWGHQCHEPHRGQAEGCAA